MLSRENALVLIVIAVLACACTDVGGTATPVRRDAPSPAAPSVGLTIVDPRGGVVRAAAIIVTGTAPAGSRIVSDRGPTGIPDAVADDAGRWRMPVTLADGANVLQFQIGDDPSTVETVVVTYEPSTTAAHTSARPASRALAAGTLVSLSGVGSRTTGAFVANGPWTLTYSYDCSARKHRETFTVSLFDGADEKAVIVDEAGLKSSGSVNIYETGRLSLAVVTTCSWQLGAVSG